MSRSKVLAIVLMVGALSLLISVAISLAYTGDTVTIRDSDDTNYSDKLSDRASIKLNLPPLASDKVYEGWFVSDDGIPQSAGVFTQDSDGNVDQTFWLTADVESTVVTGQDETGDDITGVVTSKEPTGENLFARFDKFVISIEPVPDNDPLPSADKPYIHQIPAAGILHIRHLTYSLGSNPPYAAQNFHAGTPKGLAVGLREQTWVAWVHANLSVNSTTIAAVQTHACHAVNIIEGTGDGKGANFDGACGNPGDGFGVLSYADGTALHAALAASAASDDPVIVKHHKEVVDSAGNVKAWATLARDQALFAKSATDIEAAKLFASNARSRLAQTLDGADADGDGAVERITGEGGAKQAYWAAQDMGQYVFDIAAAPVEVVTPPKTGDPILPNIAWVALALGAFLLLAGAFVFRRSRARA